MALSVSLLLFLKTLIIEKEVKWEALIKMRSRWLPVFSQLQMQEAWTNNTHNKNKKGKVEFKANKATRK